MTDDLLDEATRLADNSPGVGVGPLLRALVERVQQAESRATALSETRTRLLAKHPHTLCKFQREEVEAERDAARGKLDKVRRLIPTQNPELIEAGYGIDSRDVLAILDGKTGD